MCTNSALKAAQEAAEKQMATFYEAQGAVLDDFSERTGVDLSEAVARESHPPAIPDNLLNDEAYRRSRE